MPYCPHCGNAINIGDRFCANCGTALQGVTTTINAVNSARSDYRVVLVSRGVCSRAVAIDMLSDLLGYSDPDAARIVDNAPMEAALGLTAIQAQYISQAITEYGMQVAIYNNDGFVDMGSRATTSVFNSDGSFLSAVASVLTGLTVSNRISAFNRWATPVPVLFRPVYRRSAPPPAYRRRHSAPRPAPIPAIHAMPPRPVSRPVTPPAPPRSVANSRPGGVPHPAPTPRPMNAPGPVGPGPVGPVGPMGPGNMGPTGRGPGNMGPAGGRRG